MKSDIKDKLFISSLLGASLIFLAVSILIGASKFANISGELILNIDASGGAILGSFTDVISIFGIFSVIIIINSILVYEFFKRNRFISYALSITTILIAIMVLIATLMIGGLN